MENERRRVQESRSVDAAVLQEPAWSLLVDHRERRSKLMELAENSPVFDVRVQFLSAGDYIVNDRIAIERKTYQDFALSVIDGRLFAQAAALKRLPQRPVVLVEGPRPARMPRVHPTALKGALLSLAVAWGIPVVFTRGPSDSLSCLEILGQQSQAVLLGKNRPAGTTARRSRGPKGLRILQSLPGVGPRLARLLLERFGSVEKAMLASAADLADVPGCGPTKAARIREVLRSGTSS